MYVVYMDILFLINVIMNSIIFCIVTMILNKHIKVMRLIIGSIIGALLYCMLIVFPVLQGLPYGVYTLTIPILSILYIYKPLDLKAFIKIYLICTGVAFLIGGATFSLWYVVGYNQPLYAVSIFYMLSIGLLVGGCIYLSFYMLRRRLIMPLFEYDIEIKCKDKEIHLKSILDTGNCLYTPISHRPVVVITYDAFKQLLTSEEKEVIESCHYNVQEMLKYNEHGPKYIIPFNSIGCESGMLWGMEVDEMNICKTHFKRHIPKCIVGIAFGPLFSDQAYKALLHPDFIMNEGEE